MIAADLGVDDRFFDPHRRQWVTVLYHRPGFADVARLRVQARCGQRGASEPYTLELRVDRIVEVVEA